MSMSWRLPLFSSLCSCIYKDLSKMCTVFASAPVSGTNSNPRRSAVVDNNLKTLKHVCPTPAGPSAQPQLLHCSHLCPVHHCHHSGNTFALTVKAANSVNYTHLAPGLILSFEYLEYIPPSYILQRHTTDL